MISNCNDQGAKVITVVKSDIKCHVYKSVTEYLLYQCRAGKRKRITLKYKNV